MRSFTTVRPSPVTLSRPGRVTAVSARTSSTIWASTRMSRAEGCAGKRSPSGTGRSERIVPPRRTYAVPIHKSRLRMHDRALHHLVDGVARPVGGHADEVEIGGGDRGDRRPVVPIVAGREQVGRED